MRTGWRLPALRAAAFWLCAMIAALALSGLGLYYVASESAVSVLRWLHVLAGVLLPCWLALHIARGRRITRRL